MKKKIKSIKSGRFSITDLTGQKFGRLTIIEFDGVKNGNSQWRCQCDCGNNIKIVDGQNLKRGQTKSCGCLLKERENLLGQKFNRWTILERGRN